jgi:lysophospholipase L1-like esterase
MTRSLGSNDATLPPSAQSLPLEKYIANLNHYVSSLIEPASEYYQPSARIVLITPPPIVQSMRMEMPLPPGIPKADQGKERDLNHSRKFKDACLAIGKEWKAKTGGRVQVIDFWKVIVDAAGSEQDDDLRPFFTDGLHLTPPGYRLLFDELMEVLHSAGWDDLNPNAMKMTVPRYVAGTKDYQWYSKSPLLDGKA